MYAPATDAGRAPERRTNVFTHLTDDLLDLVATELGESDLYAANLSDCCCLACCSCCCVGGD
jgi:hypothetical protein